MRNYNGLRERPDTDGLYGFIRQPVLLDEFNNIIGEGSIYFAGNPKAFDGQIVTFVREEKDGGMIYRLADRRKKPYPPPDGRRVTPRTMLRKGERPAHERRSPLQKTNAATPAKKKPTRAARKKHQPPPTEPTPTITYRQELTRCNNERCKKCRESLGHGPYWYAYWREGPKVRKKYLGKTRPDA